MGIILAFIAIFFAFIIGFFCYSRFLSLLCFALFSECKTEYFTCSFTSLHYCWFFVLQSALIPKRSCFSWKMSEVAETTTTTQSEKIVRSQQPGELQNIQATYRLDGKNYLKWSQLVRTVLKRKKKINHLMSTGSKPGDPSFKAWDE